MKILDANHLSNLPPKPIQYLVERLIPLGVAGDIFSMPEASKSSILLNLAAMVANGGGQWFGHFPVVGGNVVIIGGEKSSQDVWVRDLNRLKATIDNPDRLIILEPETFLWEPCSKSDWRFSAEASNEILPFLLSYRPVLIIIDTISRAAKGNNVLDLLQQVELARQVDELQRSVGGTVLTVSHTSQSSDTEPLFRRLHFISRQGGNGYPGWLRYLLALTELREEEKTERRIDVRKQVIAMAVAKNSEMPRPRWGNRKNPILYELKPDGSIELIPEDESQVVVSGKRSQASGKQQNCRSRLFNLPVQEVDDDDNW